MSDDGPSMEELREGSTFGDRDDPNAASPYDGDADDDPDDDSIREDLIDRIGDKVSGPENRSIGCRDPMFAAYLDHLADDGERMDDVIADLADDLNTTVPEEPQKADVIRVLLRLGLRDGAPEEYERLVDARGEQAKRSM
ncbi:hypothetical protein [Halorubrum lacusprofundi]|jgi:hypothetical protein|uniref:hypothetical protein n=1 Tax=Halorubrum lacusprofundi TaxID=2247 RepID=UPI000B5A232E|nr:hypothetical protein [Halorubrum lacusprofundi]MCG1008252.1 hypothetical protein [Halorubrum lacusprofundi]